MNSDHQLDRQRLEQLAALKAAFAAGLHQEVLNTIEQLEPLDKLRSGIRVEAIALAARSQIALGERRLAHALLRQLWKATLKNHRHCRYAAIATLELGNYRRALSLTEKAAEFLEATKAEAKEAG